MPCMIALVCLLGIQLIVGRNAALTAFDSISLIRGCFFIGLLNIDLYCIPLFSSAVRRIVPGRPACRHAIEPQQYECSTCGDGFEMYFYKDLVN